MKGERFNRNKIAALLLATVALLILSAGVCLSQTMPLYAPNEIILTLQAGSGPEEAQRIAQANGMTVAKALILPNTYVLRWNQTRADTVESKIDAVKLDSAVARVYPNYCFYRSAVPNDPRYPEQWHYELINMPDAWNLEKGKDTVIVAVVDDGISTSHPDITDRLIPGTDIAMGDNDPNYQPGDTWGGHGLHVAGTIGATTDNGIGVAGVCWSGVQIMPVKVFADNSPFCLFSDVSDGCLWAMSHGADVINMSLGGSYPPPGFQDTVDTLVAAGVVVVAAAGNDSGPVGYPAAFDGVIAVSAVNRDGLLTYYSNFGPEIDIAAPGGEQLTAESDGVLSTTWEDGQNIYAFFQGTSMASPHIAGVAALLLSAGVRPADVEPILKTYAKPTPAGAARPNDQYGWGVLDAKASLQNTGAIVVESPTSGQKVNTGLPRVRIHLAVMEKTSVRVYFGLNADANSDGIPDGATTPVIDAANIDKYYNQTSGILEFQFAQRSSTDPTQPVPYPIQPSNLLLIDAPLTPNTYRVHVSANRSLGVPATFRASRTFNIEPRVVQSGLRFISVPCPLPFDDGDPLTEEDPKAFTASFLATDDFQMARWLPSQGSYAMMNVPDIISDSRASLFPPDAGVHPHGGARVTPPAGLGFWLRGGDAISLLANGFVDYLSAYDIPLTAGWNMIGDPFPFNVDWNSVLVTYQGRTRTVSDAVALGWLRPALYRYTANGYAFESLPGGMLMPWEGNWIRVLKGSSVDPVVLSIPPIPSHLVPTASSLSSTSRLAAAPAGKDNWTIRLAVTAGTASDNENILGISSRASDGYDPSDVETPPLLKDYVDLSFPHADWGDNSGLYARDVRSVVAGTGKTWEVDVATDLPNTDVRLMWPDISPVPRDYNLILEDVDSAKRVFMRHRSAYTYNSGPTPGKRHLKLTLEPANATRLVLTSVDVVPTRGSSVNVSYSVSRDARVEVRVRSGLSKLVRTLGTQDTRAAGIGSVTWDGRAADGSVVGPGHYIFEVIATDVDGQVAKRVCPFIKPR